MHTTSSQYASVAAIASAWSSPGSTSDTTDTECSLARPLVRPFTRLGPPERGGQGRYGVTKRMSTEVPSGHS